MKRYIQRSSVVVLVIGAILLNGCVTCKTPYRRELSNNPNLREANASYKKAIGWLDKAECASIPYQAKESYATAESYVSDAIFKLEKSGQENNINVSKDVDYCEKIKRETAVKIGAADRIK
jgi:hypothetical protein